MLNYHTADEFTMGKRSGVTRRRAGFTLIELLIVVSLILLLAAITATTVNVSINNDKVRAGARQVQSYLAGARDRAIYSGAPRGVRFLLDPTNNRTVSSMIFIKQTDPWTQGTIQLERLNILPTAAAPNGTADGYNSVTNPNPPAFVVRGFDNDPNNPFATPTNWVDLFNQGLLSNGTRIKIPNDSTGIWYTVTTDLLQFATAVGQTPYYPPRLRLTTAYEIPANNTNGAQLNAFSYGGPQTYQIELPPSVLPGADAVQMPKGSVVHLDRCTTPANVDVNPGNRGDKLPAAWKTTPSVVQLMTGAVDPSGFDYTTQMDVMFSPRGVVIGSAAQRGIIHLYIADQKDADRDRLKYWSVAATPSAPEYGTASDGYFRSDKVVLSLFTRTGAVSTHSVFNGVNPQTGFNDTFKYAETGEVAGK